MLIELIIGLILLAVVCWAVYKIYAVVTIPEPFKTILFVFVTLVIVFAFVAFFRSGFDVDALL